MRPSPRSIRLDVGRRPRGARSAAGRSARLVVGLCVLLLVTAALAAGASRVVVLGKRGLLPHGRGWGSAHPARIDNGGDPNGTAWQLRWTGWGSPVARARGLTWIFRPNGGYFSKPGAIELRASRIGRCTPGGPPAYTRLEAREALRPGGRLSRWFAWGGWKTTCSSP
jgi:hypothetical protein